MKVWMISGGAGLAILAVGVTLYLSVVPGRSMVRTQGYTLTWYSIPRKAHPGEVQLAVRVQDREYRVLENLEGCFVVTERPAGTPQRVMAQPGPGKDLRGWVSLSQAGMVDVQFSFWLPQGNTITAHYRLRVLPRAVPR